MEHDWHLVIDSVVQELLQELGYENPPVDAVESLKHLGMEVAVDSSQSTRGRQKTLAGRKAVFLKPEPRPERFQWSAAHELGEVHAWKIFQRFDEFDDEPSPRLREQIANQFASCFLLPEKWFRQDALRLKNHLYELKSLYCTASHELIARRLLDFESRMTLTIIDRSQVTSRVASGGGVPPGMTLAEKTCWKETRESGQPRRAEADSLAVAAWPIHEAGWKREIMIATFVDAAEDEAFG